MSQRRAKLPKDERQQLRQPDEFQLIGTQSIGWVRTHQTLVIAIAACLMVSAAGGAFLHYRGLRAVDAAAIEFRLAHARFASGEFAEAATAFGELATTRGDTAFGRVAGLYRAHALARQGDPAAAAAYGAFSDTTSADYLRQAALIGVGATKEGTDLEAALDVYTKASALPGPYRTEADLGAARVHLARGQSERAQEIYVRLWATAEPAMDPSLRTLLTSKLSPELRTEKQPDGG